MRIKETKLYQFFELSEDAQERAIENLHFLNVEDSFWYEFTLENATEVGKILGIQTDPKHIFFSGFSSQGDGACFEGRYSYKKGSRKEIRNYAPQDSELHSIAHNLYLLQRRYGFTLWAESSHTGRYSHPGSVSIQVDCGESYQLSQEDEESLEEILRDFMYWIYHTLEKEYDYLTSKEAIQETIEANEYEFTEEGKLS